MTNLEDHRHVSARLAAVRAHGASQVERARAQVAMASRELDLAQRKAQAATAHLHDVLDWARAPATSSRTAVREHLLSQLAVMRDLEQRSHRGGEASRKVLDSSRNALGLVRARQEALDRLAQRMARRQALGEQHALAREYDDRWLQAAAPGGRRS